MCLNFVKTQKYYSILLWFISYRLAEISFSPAIWKVCHVYFNVKISEISIKAEMFLKVLSLKSLSEVDPMENGYYTFDRKYNKKCGNWFS